MSIKATMLCSEFCRKFVRVDSFLPYCLSARLVLARAPGLFYFQINTGRLKNCEIQKNISTFLLQVKINGFFLNEFGWLWNFLLYLHKIIGEFFTRLQKKECMFLYFLWCVPKYNSVETYSEFIEIYWTLLGILKWNCNTNL